MIFRKPRVAGGNHVAFTHICFRKSCFISLICSRFFINHQDKSTTWVDPRFTQQPASNAHQNAAQSLNQSGFGARSHGAPMIPMNTKSVQFGSTTSTQFTTEDDEDESESEMDFDQLFASTTGSHGQKVDIQKLNKIKQQFPTAPEEVIKSFLLRNSNSEVRTTNQLYEAGYKREVVGSHPAPKVVDMTERLRAMFPTANRDLVNDILSQSDNDEKQARSRLEAIGYKATFPTTHRDTSRTTSPARGLSPAKQASPAKRPTSPAKQQISEAEKKRLVTKVSGQFPKLEKSYIEMALQVCHYDESRVKTLLERVGDKPSAQPSRPSTSNSGTRSVSPTPVNDISHGLEPVVMSYDVDTRPSTSDRGKSSRSTTSSSRPQSKSRSPTPTSRPQSKTRSATPKSATKQNTQRAKKVTQGPTGSVVSSQPQGSAYVSPNRTPAIGPDPSIRCGPNKELLLTDYTAAVGPNPELREGPDPSRVQGSQGAVGPDWNLHCGPQIGLDQGSGDRALLITAI